MNDQFDDGALAKVGAVVASLAAAWLAQKLLGIVWRRVTGNPAPRDPNAPDLKIAQAATFAAISGALSVLARRYATRAATAALSKHE